MATLYIEDINDIECPVCKAKTPTILFPTSHLGYRFWCGACKHEEPILKDDLGNWYWMINRAPANEPLPISEGAA